MGRMLQRTGHAPRMTVSEATYETMLAEWVRTQIPAGTPVDTWETSLSTMRAEMLELRSGGMWRTGGVTLLRQLGLQHNEVILCRGLSWLLTPDGWHGLGDAFLRRFVDALALPTESVDRATVSLEELRGGTRADIVVRYPGACVLIEAKVFAGEQPGQADRLAREWDEENPHLIFLTREGREPLTAVESAGRWSAIRWSDLATLASTVVQGDVRASSGALELIETWKNYGG